MCEDDSVVCYSDAPPLPAAIDDLFEVKMFLRNLIDWQSLGLALGLLYPTLEMIAKEKHGNIGECKMEMLAAWLKKEDNVPQKGDLSWLVLQSALRRMGENELADRITQDSPLMVGCEYVIVMVHDVTSCL